MKVSNGVYQVMGTVPWVFQSELAEKLPPRVKGIKRTTV